MQFKVFHHYYYFSSLSQLSLLPLIVIHYPHSTIPCIYLYLLLFFYGFCALSILFFYFHFCFFIVTCYAVSMYLVIITIM